MLNTIATLTQSKELANIINALKTTQENTSVFLSDFSITPLLASAIQTPIIYITSGRDSAIDASTMFENCNLRTVTALGAPDMPVYSETASIQNTELSNAANTFMGGGADVLILTAPALLSCIPKTKQACITLNPNQKLRIKDLIETLENFGFTRTQAINEIGEYTVRGDVVDLYPEGSSNPIRVMFFDDIIEQIKTISLDTFLSTGKLESLQIFPIAELANISPEKIRLKLESLKSQAIHPNTKSIFKSLLTRAEKFENLSGVRWLLPFLSDMQPILDIILSTKKTSTCHIVFDRPREILDTLNITQKQNSTRLASLLEGGVLLPQHASMFTDTSTVIKSLTNTKCTCTGFQSLNSSHDLFKASKTLSLKTLPTTNYFSAISVLVPDLIRNTEVHKKTVLVFVDTSKALENYLKSKGVDYNTVESITSKHPKISPNKINVIYAPLSVSFELPDSKTVIYSVTPTPHTTQEQNVFTKSSSTFTLPKVGEVVVHETHGLGRYLGIKKLSLAEIERDYIVLQYEGGSFVYLPPEQTAMLSNYTGEPTRLNRIGGKDFASAKQRVRRRLKELSFKLSKLYAKRTRAIAHEYDCDDSILAEFAASFKHDYTPDQLKAIQDIAYDMTGRTESIHQDKKERPGVMDRLICGDVGFGKTEVALHAVLRAVESGYQVALLCPTTILSVQHGNTAKERLEKFGVRTEVLNRFKTAAEVQSILADVKNGKVDLLIGTHRLLSSDVEFKNLSLLILDEEQRFGVGHKERIKQLKTNIDVLTLSATPIPRTLNMALIGVRDISTIATAPKNRNPVITYVVESSEALITDAIEREVARGGQTLVLFNNVEKIDAFAYKLKALLSKNKKCSTLMRLGGLGESQPPVGAWGQEPPQKEEEISIAIAHGQMPARRLEDTIVAMYNREIDVLVASTIIENGIDISSANTLIVIDSDKLGVAQMHQLRGRVGRSTTQAFAYFTFDERKELSEISRQRLMAIQAHSRHGSGYDIAMRDLQLRGAGDLLGAKQSGHIEQIGFDMYCKILKEVALENKLESENYHSPFTQKHHDTTTHTIEKHEPVLDIALNCFIPQTYIENEQERLRVYRAISEIQTRADCDKVLLHLGDIYGKPPTEVKNIILVGYIHALAKNKDIKLIKQNKHECRLVFHKEVDQHATIQSWKTSTTPFTYIQKENLHLLLKVPTIANLISLLENQS